MTNALKYVYILLYNISLKQLKKHSNTMAKQIFAWMVTIVIVLLELSCTTRTTVQNVSNVINSNEAIQSEITTISTQVDHKDDVDDLYIVRVLEWNTQIDTLLNHGKNYYDLGSQYVFDHEGKHITVVVYKDREVSVWQRPIGTVGQKTLSTWSFDETGLNLFIDAPHRWFVHSGKLFAHWDGDKYTRNTQYLRDTTELHEPTDKEEIMRIQETMSTIPKKTQEYLTILARIYGYK